MKNINFKQLYKYDFGMFLRINTDGFPMIARDGNKVRFIYEIDFQNYLGKKIIRFNYANDTHGHTSLYYPKIPPFNSAESYYISPYSLLIVIFRGNLIWS